MKPTPNSCEAVDDPEIKFSCGRVPADHIIGVDQAAVSKSGQCGLASVYSTDSEKTTSGEDTQPKNLTAAHRSLPFGTLVRVVNQETGARRLCGSLTGVLSRKNN